MNILVSTFGCHQCYLTRPLNQFVFLVADPKVTKLQTSVSVLFRPVIGIFLRIPGDNSEGLEESVSGGSLIWHWFIWYYVNFIHALLMSLLWLVERYLRIAGWSSSDIAWYFSNKKLFSELYAVVSSGSSGIRLEMLSRRLAAPFIM